MRRVPAVLVVLVLVGMVVLVGSGSVSAQAATETNHTTTHDVSYYDSNETAVVTTQLHVVSDSKQSYWTFDWALPSDPTVVAINDTQGRVEYERTDDGVAMSTNRGVLRSEELITVRYKMSDAVIERQQGVEVVKLSLMGLVGESRARVSVVGGEVFSASAQSEHEFELDGNRITYDGQNSLSTVFVLSDESPARETDHYAFYGANASGVTDADAMYALNVNITGVEPNINKIPVVFVPDEKYYNNSYTSQDTLATYYRGLVRIPQSSTEDVLNTHVSLAHETTHAFNDRISSGLPQWFEEGSARIVEQRAKEQFGIPHPEVFGEAYVADRPCPDNPERSCTFRYYPAGELDALVEYTQSDSKWMSEWSATKYPNRTQFGYAYSELFFREYLNETESNQLTSIYDTLANDDFSVTPQNRTEYALAVLGHQRLTVCENTTSASIKDCVAASNEQPGVQSLNDANATSQDPDVEFSPVSFTEPETEYVTDRLSRRIAVILDSVAEWFARL
jgi:hypothetical protein